MSRTAKQILPSPPPGFILPLMPCDASPPRECLCLYACLSSYHRLPLEDGHCYTHAIARALAQCKRRHLHVSSPRKKCCALSLSHCNSGVHLSGSGWLTEGLDQLLSPVFQQNVPKPELLTSRRVDLRLSRGVLLSGLPGSDTALSQLCQPIK